MNKGGKAQHIKSFMSLDLELMPRPMLFIFAISATFSFAFSANLNSTLQNEIEKNSPTQKL